MNEMGKKKIQNKKYNSIKSILIGWFIIFSILPLVFLGWYSVYKFEEAFNLELSERLQGNGREIESIFSDYYKTLETASDVNVQNESFRLFLSVEDKESLKNIGKDWLYRNPIQQISFYDKTGKLISSTFRDEKNFIKFNDEEGGKTTLLNERYLSSLNDRFQLGTAEIEKNKITLILLTKVMNENQKVIGYFEQSIILGENFSNKLKSKLKVELFFLNDKKVISLPTINLFDDFIFQTKNFNSEKLFNFDTEKQKFGVLIYQLNWDRAKFYVGFGTIRKDSQAILKNVNIAFITIVTLVSIFLILTILITTNLLLKPLENLINGFKSFDQNESLIQLPVSNKNEIGLLTEAFNEMSYKIFQARNDLRKKIKELEKTNTELMEAQSKLVHSAKMNSLGQLVAGVAHELNNPIGFIYSNMSQLKEYAENLFKIVDLKSNNDPLVENLKNELDYEFIKKDLPRLIKSCQDGAQRTRDIVLGLRNFSRIEEAQLKEVDIQESIDTTLDILNSEIKNRIDVIKNYSVLPKVLCFASQINQVLMNIISNALQAINSNGKIWITTSLIKGNQNLPSKIQISIQDSGIGMDAHTLEKIFEPFFTTKGVGQGTGLGLSISYGIIQNHGGEIQVRSQKNVGTEFIIILPIKAVNFKK